MFFTGHRPKDLPGKPYDRDNPKFIEIVHRTKQVIEYCYLNVGMRRFIFGGALGFDKMAFYAAYEVKEKYQDIVLILAIPYENQPLAWVQGNVKQACSSRNKELYPSLGSWFETFLSTTKDFWGRKSVVEYLGMIARSDYVIYVDELEKYKVGRQEVGIHHVAKLDMRNKAMVDMAALGLAFFNGKTGGTYNCIEYAKKKNRSLIIMTTDEYKLTTLIAEV
jgi:uncharacterized phage-like protein YoqJ